MFGYIIADVRALGAEDKRRYREWYCGLCESLRVSYGARARATLNYDMTFLTILLSSVRGLETAEDSARCFVHPLKSHSFLRTDATDYAAAANILLSYWKTADDIRDDKSARARLFNSLLKNAFDRAKEKLPEFCKNAQEHLDELTELEKRGIIDPDRACAVFGRLCGEMFSPPGESQKDLYAFGDALGRFLYILDACADLRADIRRERYNPMVSLSERDHYPYLKMLAGHMDEAYRALPVSYDRDILNNILYSGIWLRYELKTAKKRS